MACKLSTEQIGDVFGLIYHKINKAQGPYNIKDFVKFFYDLALDSTGDKEKALLYAQAVPEIFAIVALKPKITPKLVSNNFDFNELYKLNNEFNNLDKVNETVSPETETFEEVEADLKNINETKEDVETDDDNKIAKSDLEARDGAKIEYPNTTSLQTAKSTDPTTFKKGANRNPQDVKKDTFAIVQRNIIAAIRTKAVSSTDLMYGDTPIVLSLVKASLFPKKHKLNEHLSAADNESVGIFAVITDKEGNYLYFDKEGNLVNEDEGTVVYTHLRMVEKVNGKLILQYYRKLNDNELYNYENTLVNAAEIANREAKLLKAQGFEIDEDYVDVRTQEIYDEQKSLMNGLYKLRNEVLATDDIIKVDITDGSMGVYDFNMPYKSVKSLDITVGELEEFNVFTDPKNPKTGYSYITVNIETPVGNLPFKVVLQKGDFDSTLADKLATILTTKAKLNGKPLSAREREKYYKVFINNQIKPVTKMNRENILVKAVQGKLIVTIVDVNGKETTLKEDGNLFSKEAYDIIYNHLLNRELDALEKPIPVSIQINKDYKGKSFVDYEVKGDTITTKFVKYADFLRDYAKGKLDNEFLTYLHGTNPYLVFEIPAQYTSEPEFDLKVPETIVKEAPKKTNEEKYEEARTVDEPDTEFEEDVELFTADSNEIDQSDFDDDEISDLMDELDRSKKLDNFLDRLFTTKADRERAEEIWAKSPLSKHISLNRMAQIVNSNAFATFSAHGITLFEGDGGTAVDLYHEAWHGFSQLFLTKPEKIKLYNELKGQPKWANKSFWEIEEDIAEDYRDYARSRGRREAPKGFLGKVFQRIYQFLDNIFGKVDRTQARLRPRDIPAVKEMFDLLYDSSARPELFQNMQPSTENMMFTKLNRTKLIKPVKEFAEHYAEFTESESIKAATLIDSFLPKIFMQYNKSKDDRSGAIKMLYNINNRAGMYKIVEKLLQKKLDKYRKNLAELAANGEDVADYEIDNMTFIGKILDNFGDIEKSIEGSQKRGVVAYHLDNSRFKILSNKFVEIENDPTDMTQSQLFKLDGGNTLSSKDLASETTKTILSSIYKVDRSKFKTEIEDGKKKFNIVYELDEFDEPILVDFNIMWNKLAKILAGSFDQNEMYSRLYNAVESEPEIQQLLSLLPNQAKDGYKDSTEFIIDMNFWQDLKKPRISYMQLNINASKDKTGSSVYDLRVARTDFNTQSVIRDWNFGFVMDDPNSNKYLMFDDVMGNYRLNINKLFNDFINKDGSFKLEKSTDFLNAIGVRLDYTNKAILNEVSQPNFGLKYGIDHIFNTIRSAAYSSSVESLQISRNPIKFIMEGTSKNDETSSKINISNTRINELAKLQARNSDKYSNFAALSPEGNTVWEHFLDNSITRIITSINHAKSWQELTRAAADPLNKFQHMRWLSENINTFSIHSMLLNSLFDLKDRKKPNGKRLDNNLLLNNVAGTQLLEQRKDSHDKKEGISTSAMDATGKFLQELHTMLMNGIEEFVRHASKQMSQGLTVTGKIDTGSMKSDGKLYVDIADFTPYGDGKSRAFEIIVGYIVGEANRIHKFGLNKDTLKNYAGYNRKVTRKDNKGTETMAGDAFTAFDDVLTEDTQELLYKIIDGAVKDKNSDFDMMDVLDINTDLRLKLEKDVTDYFTNLTKQNVERLNTAKFIDSGLRERIPKSEGLSNTQVETALVKAYTYNSWIHKFETSILIYGDLAQYNHAKEEFHKRNAGFGGGGRGFSNSRKALEHINSLKNYYAERFKSDGVVNRPYDGTLNTAILRERKVSKSIYYDEYYPELVKEYTARLGDKTKAEALAKTVLKEYNDMKIGDGQGHISFEAYRKLKNLEGNWLPEQEELYQKVAKGEEITTDAVVKFFPPYKLQYIGNIESDLIPVTSFHKFSLAPIIPGVAKQDTPLYKLHMKMMKDQIDYVVYETGSKIGHIGNGDEIFDKEGNFIEDSKFTVNKIFTEFLKNQTEVNAEYKEKSIFSTQMRKLILDNLYKNGKITSAAAKPVVEKYLKDVTNYTELVKLELLEEIGYDEVAPNQYEPRDKDSISKLLELIRSNLEREDAYSNEMIDFIDALDSGQIKFDLSYHPEVLKIEKVLLSLINKRIIKQKIKGEPLVQVSSAMYENNVTKTEKFRNATDEDKKKWVGSNVLPTYHKKADGKTAAMKVMIALQGDYANLLNLEYKGATIETIDRLNQAIKDDEWLDANDGANRKAITLVGVRIPVQGLNSMEFMEVYEFLPAQAGNIIIPPAEIVAKSGGDFDIDKLTIFMTNIGTDGGVVKADFESIEYIKELIKEKNENNESLKEMFKIQKASLENELIADIKNILELPENFTSLITPNGTFLLKDIADDLSQYVMAYNPYGTLMTKGEKKNISPTRVLETMYNLYKHESNIVGKRTLGLGAVENTFNILLNSIGAYLPKSYKNYDGTVRNTSLALRHRTMNVNGEERVSLSDIYDVDNVNKIADIFSQAINGWVDVEKDAWIFFIQGNYEVAPTLLFLVKAGVPVKEAIYFVSQPLVREYVEEQRAIKSTFAPLLNKSVESPNLVKSKAVKEIIRKHFPKNILTPDAKSKIILDKADDLIEIVFKDKENKFFTEKLMYNLIVDSAKDPKEINSNKSLAMFLHFLKIEDQIKGITQVKLNANPDTNTRSSLTDIEASESTLEDLNEDEYLSELISGLMQDSVISSFFNGSLALALSKPLFKLRYNKIFSEYILSLRKSGALNKLAAQTFGENKKREFVNAYRNDFVSYIFQNALLKSNIDTSYMSLELKDVTNIKKFESQYFGAYVQTNDNGTKTLYVNDNNLREEFEERYWAADNDEETRYDKLGLHKLDSMTFSDLERGENFNQYKRFVIEREYLRSQYPREEKQSKADYEKFLAEKALDNTHNFYHLFNNSETAYANRISNLINEYPLLFRKFEVLGVLKPETNMNQSIFNLGLVDRDINTTKANLYTRNLKDLADPKVLNAYAKELKLSNSDIDKITNLFSMMPLFAYLQTGINKSSYNLVPFVDSSKIIPMIIAAGDAVTKMFEENPEATLFTLTDYTNKFVFANSKRSNPLKKQFRNYLTKLDVTKIEFANETSGKVIAIIGTAGRSKVPTLSEWNKMVQDASSKVSTNDVLISGGAAFADHVAVRLFLDGKVQGLKLRLPAKIKDGKFVGDKGTAGGTANFYHEKFSKLLGVNTVAEIEAAIAKGAEVSYEKELSNKAMFDRNKKVAAESNSMIAYTYGEGTEPADGGTKNTWDTAKYSDKTHVQIDKITTQPATSVKTGVQEVFKSNPDLTSIGTEQQYSQYLDTVFPDSKVKDIVYHSTPHYGFEKFSRINLGTSDRAGIAGFDFLKSAKATERYLKGEFIKGNNSGTYAVILNIKNPQSYQEASLEKNDAIKIITSLLNDNIISEEIYKTLEQYINTPQYGTDKIYAGTLLSKLFDKVKTKFNLVQAEQAIKEYNKLTKIDSYFQGKTILEKDQTKVSVFEPEQIHILGSKQDIEGFKEFVSGKLSTQPAAKAEAIATPLGLVDVKSDLIETDNPSIFLYDSKDKKPNDYKSILEKNSKVVFLHSFSISEYNDKANKNFTNQSAIQLYSPDMSLPIVTTNAKNDNLSDIPSANYDYIKANWAEMLNAAANIVEKGGYIAFPTEGFGDSTEMPQELFVYLSRELYDKFRYLNPGSLLFKEVNELVSDKQGVSDDEILQTYGFESDPFNCA